MLNFGVLYFEIEQIKKILNELSSRSRGNAFAYGAENWDSNLGRVKLDTRVVNGSPLL